MLGNMKLFLVLNRISHSFALLTREISWSTLEINFIFPHIHVLFSIYYITMALFFLIWAMECCLYEAGLDTKITTFQGQAGCTQRRHTV